MAETADVERKLAAMANWRTGLEPDYLLRLFFRFPPQDFAAWPQEIPRAAGVKGYAARPDSAGNPPPENKRESRAAAGGESAMAGQIQAAAEAGGESESAAGEKTAAADTAEIAMPPAGGEPESAVAEAKTEAAPANQAAEAAEAEVGRGPVSAAPQPPENGRESRPAGEGGSEPVSAALPFFACRFNLLTVLEPEWLKKLKKLPFYRSFSRMLSFKTLFAGATVSEFLPLPLPLPAASAAAAAGALRAEGGDWPFVIVKDLPQGENALVSADIAAAAAAFDAALAARGFISVEGQALAYVPVNFADINAYLARFSKARRKNFRRKLRAREELSIDILMKGAAEFYDETALALYYRLYEQVYAQSETHFDYLSRAFFRALLQEADDSLRFIRYHDKAGRLIGYNICFIVGDRLVDKYIGLDYPAATDYSIYFVSWFYNLEYAREQGLRYYVAGWTDPHVKACLGAKFVMTRHRVFIRNPLLRAALRRLQFLFEGDAAATAGGAHNAAIKAEAK